MRIVVTGATGLVGKPLLAALRGRGDTVVVLSRDGARARESLGVEAHSWDPLAGPAPAAALGGADAVIHLAGEAVAGGRWNEARKRAIRDSRVIGTKNLVAGIAAAEPRPRVLVSASAVGYYGDRPELVDETATPGSDFLAGVVREWEAEALKAREHGLRVACLRIGVVLAREGGALAKMTGPFKAGVGGRLGSGRQGMPWVHLDDVVGLALHALDREDISGPINVVAPQPVDNAAFTKALGRALHRPTILPTPGFALKLLFGEMASVLLGGQKVEPKIALATGYRFRHADLDGALASVYSG